MPNYSDPNFYLTLQGSGVDASQLPYPTSYGVSDPAALSAYNAYVNNPANYQKSGVQDVNQAYGPGGGIEYVPGLGWGSIFLRGLTGTTGDPNVDFLSHATTGVLAGGALGAAGAIGPGAGTVPNTLAALAALQQISSPIVSALSPSGSDVSLGGGGPVAASGQKLTPAQLAALTAQQSEAHRGLAPRFEQRMTGGREDPGLAALRNLLPAQQGLA